LRCVNRRRDAETGWRRGQRFWHEPGLLLRLNRKRHMRSYWVVRAKIRFMFQAMVTRLHSPRTLLSPRSRNCRKPRTDLMMPNTGSGALIPRPDSDRSGAPASAKSLARPPAQDVSGELQLPHRSHDQQAEVSTTVRLAELSGEQTNHRRGVTGPRRRHGPIRPF
jgi:hypothetical protein